MKHAFKVYWRRFLLVGFIGFVVFGAFTIAVTVLSFTDASMVWR